MSDTSEQTILVIDLDPDFLEWASKHLSVPGVTVVTESNPALAVTYYMENKPDLVISEYALGNVSGIDLLRGLRQQEPNAMVILTTGFPSTKAVIESMKLGAYDFLGKQGLVYDLRPVVENALKASEEMKNTSPVKEAQERLDPDETIIGNSPAMQDVFKMIGRVSRSDAPVMITGESGCGKEVVAGAIHKFSPRSRAEFVAINCAAIPENLLESELFGHEKGSFSGASQRRAGRFEQCDGGTLFLDEIGDMPLQVQSKILRVLQEGEFSRVGGNETIKTDVRILAATNKDLEDEVESGGFREDLFYRLNVVRIHLPPLRHRREDIPLLAEFFLKRLTSKRGKGARPVRLSPDAVDSLGNYDWPGNVRELENTLQRALALANSDVLLPKDIPLGRVPSRSAPHSRSDTPGKSSKVDEAIQLILKTMSEDKAFSADKALSEAAVKKAGSVGEAAKLLGITEAAFKKRLAS